MANPVFNFTNFKKMAILLRDHRPEQVINTLRFAYHALRGFPATRLPYEPVWLVTLITARCNLHCRQCAFRGSEDLPGTKRFRDMTLESFRRILELFPRAINIELSGGEPLAHPLLFEMIQLAHERRLKVHIPSNGTLLAGEIDAMLKAPVEILNVSVYGTDNASFSEVTGADASLFDATLEGVAELARRRHPGGYPRVLRTSFICTRDNLHRVPDFIRLSEKLGVDQVKLRQLRHHNMPGVPESSCLWADEPEVRDFLAGLRRQHFRLPVYLPRLPRHGDTRRCDDPFRLLAMDADGFIGPCCVRVGKSCGNLFEQPEVWNGPGLLQVRRDQRDLAWPLPSVCQFCECRIPERPRLGG